MDEMSAAINARMRKVWWIDCMELCLHAPEILATPEIHTGGGGGEGGRRGTSPLLKIPPPPFKSA